MVTMALADLMREAARLSGRHRAALVCAAAAAGGLAANALLAG